MSGSGLRLVSSFEVKNTGVDVRRAVLQRAQTLQTEGDVVEGRDDEVIVEVASFLSLGFHELLDGRQRSQSCLVVLFVYLVVGLD